MKNKLRFLQQEFKKLDMTLSNLKPKVEEIRSYYKHQNTDTDNASEDLITSFNDIDFDNFVNYIVELREFGEEDTEKLPFTCLEPDIFEMMTTHAKIRDTLEEDDPDRQLSVYIHSRWQAFYRGEE